MEQIKSQNVNSNELQTQLVATLYQQLREYISKQELTTGNKVEARNNIVPLIKTVSPFVQSTLANLSLSNS
jgi:hypothetical protein